jgi:hypothetical protein
MNGSIISPFRGISTFAPSSKLPALEKFLHNAPLEEEGLREVLEAFFELHSIESPGIAVEDWMAPIIKMKR